MKFYRIMQYDDAAPKMTPKPKGQSLGNAIRHRRQFRNMSLQDVADESGLTKSYIWDIEKGNQHNLTAKAILGLAIALDMDPAGLALIAIEEVIEAEKRERAKAA